MRGLKLTIQSIGIHMQCLTQTIEPSATALTEQSTLAHNPPYGLVVAVYPLESFQPFLHAPTPQALPIPLAAAFLYHLCQFIIPIWLAHALEIR